MLNVNQTSQALTALEQAGRVVCICHDNPDGDALGSSLGLAEIVRTHSPGTTVLTVCKDAAPESFEFLKGVHALQSTFTPQQRDLVFVLDTAEPRLTSFHEAFPRLFDPVLAKEDGITTVKIDHHSTGIAFAQLEFVDTEAASSCEIVVDLADALGMKIGDDAATALLTGIYTDTGSMMHSNTSQRVYRTCARMLTAGADHLAIVTHVYRTQKVSTLRLWGRVLEKISVTPEGGAISAVTKADFKATGAGVTQLTGAIDYVNSIPGMRFSMILSERNGKVKGSLRTLNDDVDVSAMAQKFKGGGHKKAAGFSIDGKLQPEVRWKVVPERQE